MEINLNFWLKIIKWKIKRFQRLISIFCQNFDFRKSITKIEILVNNRNFGQKSKFGQKSYQGKTQKKFYQKKWHTFFGYGL